MSLSSLKKPASLEGGQSVENSNTCPSVGSFPKFLHREPPLAIPLMTFMMTHVAKQLGVKVEIGLILMQDFP